MFKRLGTSVARLLIGLIELASLLLRPFRMGRLLRKVSLPRLRESPLRTSVTSAGIIIAVSAVVSVVMVNRSIVDSAQSTVEDVAGKADLQVRAASGGFDESLLDLLRAVPGVQTVTPVLEQTVLLREDRARGERLLLLGLNLASSEDDAFREHNRAEYEEIDRDPLAFLDSTSNIIISRALATRLGRKLHEKIALDTPDGAKNFEIWGLLDETELSNAFGGQVAIMHYQSMQAAFRRGTSIDRADVALGDSSELMATAEAIRRVVPETMKVEEPQQKNTRIARMLTGLNTAMTAASIIGVLIAMFLIYNTMLISVVQRKAEIGTLRALGTTAKQVTRLLTLEGTLVGAVASALGLVTGVGLARLMLGGMTSSVGQIYMNVSEGKLRLDGGLLFRCFLLGTLASAGATWLAARSASAVPPVESLAAQANVSRYMGRSHLAPADVAGLLLIALVPFLAQGPAFRSFPVSEVASSPALLLGAALLAPRAIQLLHRMVAMAGRNLGVATLMANQNLTRDLMRSAITAGALILGMGMATTFGVFISSFMQSANEWVEQSIPADLFITSMADGLVNHTPLPGAIGDGVAELNGVEAVEHVRMADMELRSSTVKVLSTDTAANSAHSRMKMVEGEQGEAMAKVSRGEAVLVNESLSHHLNLHRGDHIALPTRDGSLDLPIAGVNVDYISDRGVVMLDRSLYLKHWGDTSVDMFKVHARDGTDLESLRRSIAARYGEKHDLLVLTGREFADKLTSQINRVFSIMRALQAVALAIAVMGVINALSANVLDRTREIGILRAVGMKRGQVQRVVVVEGLLIGICGAFCGALVGIGAGRLVLSASAVAVVGWTIPLSPNWIAIGGMTGLLVAASALAGFFPSRSAAALRITDAVAHR
jgi:putative ABC transport system permease protein